MNRCENCDQACNTPYNGDGECFGRMTPDEREAYAKFLAEGMKEMGKRLKKQGIDLDDPRFRGIIHNGE